MEAADATAERHEATILVVDDEQGIREMLQQAFSEEGYHVLTAENAIQAMDLIEAGTPDLVVSDVMMPVLDGGQLAGIVSARQGVPVVGMTALSTLRREADEYFVAVLHKPFNLDVMMSTVEEVLANRSAPTESNP
jgi:DNA-binding NtrC family response regulator